MPIADVMALNATLVVELIVFLTVLVVVTRLVTGPLQDAMQRRRAEIDAGMESAHRAEQLLAQAETDYRSRVAEARRASRRITDDARRVAEYLRNEGSEATRQQSGHHQRRRNEDLAHPARVGVVGGRITDGGVRARNPDEHP